MNAAIEDDRLFWRTAYQAHGPAVLAFLRHRLGRREDAEDLLQETFARAIRAGSFQEGGNVRAYLLRTAHNLWVSGLRRPRLVAPLGDAEEQALAETPDSRASPEQEATWGDLRDKVQLALAGMKESYRRAFELGVLEQRSYNEIGEITGWSLAQVKINIYRARKQVLAEVHQERRAGRSET
ncbi:MAG TPA: RNA polymerase sigma factor [Thermoanaerobaculia bacterium]|nr:RNA polymerase sigma factor [Thermoanaerobaculia bacterium]